MTIHIFKAHTDITLMARLEQHRRRKAALAKARNLLASLFSDDGWMQ